MDRISDILRRAGMKTITAEGGIKEEEENKKIAFQSFGAQTASMIVRFALAYSMALAAWLAITASARRPLP